MKTLSMALLVGLAVGLAVVLTACRPITAGPDAAPVSATMPSENPATVIAATLTPPEEEIVAEATALLAQRLGVADSEIALVSITAVDWPDASLGCPEPGMMYASVITPGYELVFDVAGQEYRVHTADYPGGPQVICP